jgi:arylformamidase
MAGPTVSRLIDISPVLSPRVAVWPGDVSFSRAVACSIEAGANIDLSAITTTVHVGAHTDAPSHYSADGATIEARPLEIYMGSCEVRTVTIGRGERIYPSHLGAPPRAPRLLLNTGTFPNPDHFNPDFAALSPELIGWVHDHGVRLVGLDTPSVDLCDDKELLSHSAIAARDMAILEGVVLQHVPDGLYTLIALPLRLEGADASPVRAVLVAEDS